MQVHSQQLPLVHRDSEKRIQKVFMQNRLIDYSSPVMRDVLRLFSLALLHSDDASFLLVLLSSIFSPEGDQSFGFLVVDHSG